VTRENPQGDHLRRRSVDRNFAALATGLAKTPNFEERLAKECIEREHEWRKQQRQLQRPDT
jgi:hypothetical protein